jgi:hypothetical protein
MVELTLIRSPFTLHVSGQKNTTSSELEVKKQKRSRAHQPDDTSFGDARGSSAGCLSMGAEPLRRAWLAGRIVGGASPERRASLLARREAVMWKP